MQPDPAQSLNALVERVRAALAGEVATASDEPSAGEAADGMVRAEITPEGRVAALTIDPRMLRRPVEEIADSVRLAVNAGLDRRPQRADTGPVLAELRAAQEQSVQEMSRITQAFTDALARAQQR